MPIRLDNVTKTYRRGDEVVIALNNASFELSDGEMVAMVGPSGCGKSTCLNLTAGVDLPDQGKIFINGTDLTQASEAELTRHRRFGVGVVFQAFHLLPHLTVEENVALPQAIAGRRDREWVRELVNRVGLTHRAGHYPSELSGGEQQRTAVARALALRPMLIVADEPTGNLDSQSGQRVLELLNQLRREQNAALLLATHDDNIAAGADRVVRLQDGVIEAIEAR
ncbi:MAG: ABC transporter ATP-binding protein [Candidatus Hinthialibacter antarcticus]|nr:ABC transporter ATP-binding protein [Candidatus Hinthialibacter antarcticus]